MANREVFWHLPGFFSNFYLNQAVIKLMSSRPEAFREGYKVGSCYGTFPGAIWNGGRTVLGISEKSTMEKIIETYNNLGVPVRFTWTNSCLEKEHVYDTYCNLIMKLADNGRNQVLVNSQILEEYLREKYPNFEYISSTTKRIKDADVLEKEFEKNYRMVVLDYDMNHSEEILQRFQPFADRVEILVDEICFPNCPKRADHYKSESLLQLNFDRGECFDCPNTKTRPAFSECMKRPSFISGDEIDAYIEKGYVNFKLVGRGLPFDMIKESYLYYLVKDEYRDLISKKIDEILAKALGTRR